MVKLNKIYTRTGDGGSAGLVDGSRVSKSSPRMTAIGEVDEANAAIGVALAALRRRRDRATSCGGSRTNCSTSAPMSPRPGEIEGALRIVASQVERLEREIDAMNEALEPLTSFILPGGSAEVAALHLARTVVRRAERAAVALARSETVNPQLLAYHQPPFGPPVRRRAFHRVETRRRRAVATRRDPVGTIRLRRCVERFARDARADARPRRAAVRRRRDDPAVPRRLAGQMAPRPHHLVLRDLRAARPCARLPRRSTSASLTCSTAITKARASGTRGRSAG